ncbi:histidine phosphatase family protein [archaeon]|jgi:phosphoserine phosphatase|nr:histidine phosphatase family protein [archaeon]MBT3731247.1 histidine phosphatase family protein [archaeon]MBT4669999.1 histidine phosphatase family protein [archaeon]MBT7052365.1 histidine phosphatase family protein [archaeon]MBT7281646.1 histidine phosphatase family protein [archaeon]
MKLILVRHAETDANLSGIIQGGSSDNPLNENGLNQAKKVAECLKDKKIDLAFSSPAIRAKNTAEEILKFHKTTNLQISNELNEKLAGEFEGMKSSEVKKIVTSASFKPKGGESFMDVYDRIKDFYLTILENHKDQNILIVSHGALLGALQLFILNKEISREEYEPLRLKNAAYTILDIKDEAKLITLNNIEHLK